MANQVWKSKDGQIVSQYAERLEAKDTDEEKDDANQPNKAATAAQAIASQLDGLDFRYINGPPPKDLLNYKNMDLEMSLQAKTPTGWLSLGVLTTMALICFFLTWIVWILHG